MSELVTSVSGAIGTLTINNPHRRNAMNQAMYADLPDAVSRVTSDPAVRVMVIRGAGEAFLAGSDISEFAEHRLGTNATTYDEIEGASWDALSAVEIPMIAAIDGPCMGAGVAVASCADLRYATPRSLFAVPPARLGLAYPIDALKRLVALVGMAAAKDLVLTARRVDAAEALRIGLVTELIEQASFWEQIDKIANDIAALAPLTHRATIKTINHLAGLPGAASREEAVAAIRDCDESNDFREGVTAFAEKRKPRFRGN